MPAPTSTLPSHRYFPGRISSSLHAPEACRDSVRAQRRRREATGRKATSREQKLVVGTGLWRRCSVPSRDVGSDGTGRAQGSQEACSRCNVLSVSCCIPNPNPVTWASLYKVTQCLQRGGRTIEQFFTHSKERQRLSSSSRKQLEEHFVALRYSSIYTQTGRSRGFTSSRGP